MKRFLVFDFAVNILFHLNFNRMNSSVKHINEVVIPDRFLTTKIQAFLGV